MEDRNQQAQSILLTSYSLSESDLQGIIAQISLGSQGFCDIFLEYSCTESLSMESSIVKSSHYSQHMGAGVRVIMGEQTGFAYTDGLAFAELKHAADRAAQIVPYVKKGALLFKCPKQTQTSSSCYQHFNPIQGLSIAQKSAILQQIDHQARLDSVVVEVIASLSSQYQVVAVFDSTGTMAYDVRPLVRLNVTIMMKQGDRRAEGYSGTGGRLGYDYFTPKVVEDLVNDALRQGRIQLEAKESPAGEYPVILGPGWPGVLLHEAVGHGLEADFNRKGSSIFHDQMGKEIASPLCTVVDHGALPDRRGSLSIDDEGTPTQETILIEKGKLVGYLQDKHNAMLMNQALTGNGRRESYAHLPMPRMTNTYMLAGEHTQEVMIQSVEKGIFAISFGGGQVDITTGDFVFSMSEAYQIEKGKLTHPIKGAALVGNGPMIMKQISMVGNDLALDRGIGTCGKDGQSVPVGVGQPSIKLDSITVGGSGA